MDNKYLTEIINNHFVWGLGIGLLVWLYATIKFYLKIHRVRNEANNKLRSITAEKAKFLQHLQNQIEIDGENKQSQKKLIDDLKKENENLKSTLQALKNDPKKEEIIMLHTYDKAIHLMNERAPGFAPTWEATLKEAQLEIEKAQKGIMPFIRRIIRPSHYIVSDSNLQNKQLEHPKDN